MQTRVYELINYDVWGNATEGYWVNDAYRTGTRVEIPDDLDHRELIKLLKDEGIIRKSARYASVEIDGDGDLYFTHGPTGRPEFELREVRDE